MKTYPAFRLIRSSLFLFILGYAFFFTACRKDNPVVRGENWEVNEWVLDTMQYYYLWNTEIQAGSNLNFNSEPPEFFQSLLNERDKDRGFSRIDEFEDLSGETAELVRTNGLGISAALEIDNSGTIGLMIGYVLPESPAEEAGLKRGDIITAVDGNSFSVSGGSVSLLPLMGDNQISVSYARWIASSDGYVRQTDLQIAPSVLDEQAIIMDSIYTMGGGNKIAYLAYNHFYNDQYQPLLDVFQQFRAEGVSDLILDLRYNGGGGVAVAGVISGLIMSNFNENDVFLRYVYNSNIRNGESTFSEYFDDSFDRNITEDVKGANINLKRIFILATRSSASASELVINNLRPFLGNSNVIHIGEKTYGKNVASAPFEYEEEGVVKWTIHPTIAYVSDRDGNGDYDDGLVANYPVDELEADTLAPLGSFNDPLIAQAISLINPSALSSRLSAQRGAQRLVRKSNTMRKLQLDQRGRNTTMTDNRLPAILKK